jgi:hypothetical protein
LGAIFGVGYDLRQLVGFLPFGGPGEKIETVAQAKGTSITKIETRTTIERHEQRCPPDVDLWNHAGKAARPPSIRF